METTLATILITVAVTASAIGLGVLVWAIAKLNHRVSELEILCKDFKDEFKNIYSEFESRSLNHGDNLKNVKNDIEMQLQIIWRKFDEQHDVLGRQVEWLSRKDDEIHQRIDRNNDEMERTLDKRFDSVYRKLYNSKMINESAEADNTY